jgi:hypothetical protein
MKHLFFVVLFALVGTFLTGCNKSGINTKGIPENSAGVAYVKLQDGGKSKLLQFYRATFYEESGNSDLKVFGVHMVRDVSEVTAGLLTSGDEQGVDVVFLRGKFSEADYNARAEKIETKITVGKYTFLRNASDTLVSLLDKETLLFLGDIGHSGKERDAALTAAATAVIAAYEGNAKSYEFPPKIIELSKNTDNPIFLAASEDGKLFSSFLAQGKSLPITLPTLPDSAYIALGDDGKIAKLSLRGDFKEQSDAQQFQALAQMGIAGAQLQLGKVFQGKEKASLSESARKILSSAKYEAKDGVFTLSADSDSGELFNLLNGVK